MIDLSVSHIMASNNNTSTTGEASAAAEEPVLNGNGHDKRVPAPTKGTGKGKLKTGKKGTKDAATTYCANCGEEGDARCTGCGVVYYCRKNIVIKNGKKVNMCQQVHAPSTTRSRSHVRLHSLLITSKLACQSLLTPGALEVRRPQDRL